MSPLTNRKSKNDSSYTIQLKLPLSMGMTGRAVFFSLQKLIFLPLSLFSKWCFFSLGTVKNFYFLPIFPLYLRFFLDKSVYLISPQPSNNSYFYFLPPRAPPGGGGQNEKYTPLMSGLRLVFNKSIGAGQPGCPGGCQVLRGRVQGTRITNLTRHVAPLIAIL